MTDTSSDGPPMPPSRRVNNYDLLDEIGSGGMSRVYRARKAGTGEQFAVKVIRIEDVAADFERRLRREPEVQRGLGHENIVQLFDWFRLGDEFFLVMELVEGRSLAQMIHREAGPMPIAKARIYFRQVLQAVEHLHSLGIIHRDIKPGNILVRRDDVVKLADFGIAKFNWQQGQTKTQKGLGTPEYMSPEQARGREIDHRTDIYSLGITLFEMLTARKPFSREEETPMAYVEVIQDILSTPLPDPRSFVPGIPAGVVRLLNRATAKDPADRFQSASAMMGALDIVEDDDVSSPTVVLGSVPSTSGPATRQAPPVVVPPGMQPGHGQQKPSPQPPHRADAQPIEREPARRSRTSPLLWIVLLLMLFSVAGYFGYQWYEGQRSMPVAGLTDDDATAIVEGIARDYEAYARDHNSPALVSLYGEENVEYFRLKRATRQAILDDSEKFYARIARTDQLDVEVKKTDAVNDSTIQSEWIITYQRERDDGTLLRGVTSNDILLEYIGGEWLITRQRQKWIKRDNLEPKADTPMVVDVPVDTIVDDQTEEPPPAPPQPTVTAPSKKEVVGIFLRMIEGGNASAAWDRYVSSKMRTGDDRTRFLQAFGDKNIRTVEVQPDGERIVATVGESSGDGNAALYRMVFSFVDQNGPKIDAIEVTTIGNR